MPIRTTPGSIGHVHHALAARGHDAAAVPGRGAVGVAEARDGAVGHRLQLTERARHLAAHRLHLVAQPRERRVQIVQIAPPVPAEGEHSWLEARGKAEGATGGREGKGFPIIALSIRNRKGTRTRRIFSYTKEFCVGEARTNPLYLGGF